MRIMSTPRSMDLSITNGCNLRCEYCYHFTSPGDAGDDLPKEEWLEFFEELNRCSITGVTIEGGEPLIRDDLEELIEGIVGNRMRFNILSNGTLITDDMAVFLASTERCNGVQVSIDGSASTTHDTFRGKGNFLRGMGGIETLQRHGVIVGIRVTIHKENVRDLGNIARLLLEDLSLSRFSTNVASYMGLCRENADRIQLSIEDQLLAMETLLELGKRYDGRITGNAGPLADSRSWLEMEEARREGKDSIPGRGYLTSCGGVFSKLGVRADGVIVPCILMSHVELGRINQDQIKQIWHDHPELNRLRERRNIPLSDFEFCHGCEYINYCAGGCPALAYTITEDAYRPSPDSCLRVFLEEGGKLPVETSLM